MPSIRDEITRTFARFGKRLPEQPTTSAPSLHIKAEIGQYRVSRKLGAGGMGHVYLALDTKLGRQVALKALSPQLTADPVYVNRFQQEARAASALNHPNILTIYDFVETDGAQIIVSEYVDGITLRTALERKAVDLQQALEIMCQVASALVAAHAAGVIHRDLKPTNIMLRPDGYVKVIDFGLAKLAERSNSRRMVDYSLTRPGTVVGTVRYMSPEQARGEGVDHRGDLWSLGVVLYELVAGHPPFEGTTDNHLIVAILDSPPRPISSERSLPPGLADVLNRALAKDRKQRYQSAAEFLSSIQAVQRMSGSLDTIRIPRARQMPRHRWIYSSVLGVILAAFFVWWGPLGGRWRVRGSDWFEVGQIERLTFEGDVQRVTVSPEGKWLAYTTGSPGREILHLKSLGNSEERTLLPTDQSYSGLTFSPDSRMLFFVLRNQRQELGTLFSVPVPEFGRTPEAMVLRDVDGPIAFSPGGDAFAFVRRKELESGDTASILVASASDVHELRSIVSLHGAQIFGTLSWSRAGIAVVALPSRAEQASKPSVYIFDPNGKLISQNTSANFRFLSSPVLENSGHSVLVSALTQGALQPQLEQLFFPTGQWHTITSDLAGFDDISSTRDGSSLAALRRIARSSVWVLDVNQHLPPTRLSSETEYFATLAWLQDGRLIVPSSRSGNVNLMTMWADGHIEPFLPPQAGFESDPATVPGSQEVVYSSNAAHGGDEYNIWKYRPGAGGGPVMLTSGSNADLGPQITPDGRWVVYTSSVSGAQTLWRVPLGGGRPESVSSYRARKPFVSPDGKALVCEIRQPDGEWRVAILSLASGQILRDMRELPIDGVVRWSPDGSALDYIDHEHHIWTIQRQDLKGGKPVLLVTSPEQRIGYFAWSADGTKLAYIVSHGEHDAVLLHRASRH